MEQSTTLLLGLSGVAASRVVRHEDGTRVVHVVTAGEFAGVCPGCGVLSASLKEAVATRPRDIPYGTDGLELVWHTHRWRCRNSDCPRRTFTDSVPQVPPRRRTTGRLRAAVAHAVACNRSVAEVAVAHRIGWTTAQACVDEHTDVVLTEPAPTPVLGIDETRRGKPQWNFDRLMQRWVRVDRWDTGFVDLHGDQGLLGQAEGRTSATVTGWLCLRSNDGMALARFGALTEQMWCRWPALTPKAAHFRLYIAVMYWHALARLAAGQPLGDQYFQRCVEEIAAVWHERRPETDLRQRIIESIKESTHVASGA